jgi:hypothetical protein
MTSVAEYQSRLSYPPDWRSLVTTGVRAIMSGWQEKPDPSAEKPTRGHSLICSIK